MTDWFLDLHPVFQARLAGGFTWLVTLLGASPVLFTRNLPHAVLDALLGFAAGVMIAASVWSLIIPAIEAEDDLGRLSWLSAAVGILAGGAFLRVADRLLPHLHLEAPLSEAEGPPTHWRRTTLLVLAITLHNVPEGLAVGVAFGAIGELDGGEAATLGQRWRWGKESGVRSQGSEIDLAQATQARWREEKQMAAKEVAAMHEDAGGPEPVLSDRLAEALGLAVTLHRNQARKGSRVPYVAHLLSVAGIVLANGGGEDEAIAALLHDAVEDQGGAPTLEAIRARFGEAVAEIVAACSDTDAVPKPPWRERKKAYLRHLPRASDAARLVSAADKLDNARAVLSDYRRLGEALWSRFRGGRDGTLWYYRALAEVYRATGPADLAVELDRVVGELEDAVGGGLLR
jgi:hypothetical protein